MYTLILHVLECNSRPADRRPMRTAAESLRTSFEQQLEKLRHGVELVDVIGRAVAGESEDGQAADAQLAELLHAARTEPRDRRRFQPELLDQIVGGFGRARERARKDFGVREDESLALVYGCACEIEKRLHGHRIDFAIRDVA